MPDYLICRSENTDDYSVWRIDLTGNPFLHCVTGRAGARFDRRHQLISIGAYVLEWGPIVLQDYSPCFPYRLFRFDPAIDNPLDVDAKSVVGGKPKSTLVRSDIWRKSKFWGARPDFGNPDGAAKDYDKGDKLLLLPLGTFVLNVIPTTGRGTFKLFSFDPGSDDPLYNFPTWISGAFGTIEFGHDLIPLGDYMLDRMPETREYWLWSFDPRNETALARPAVQEGRWDDIDDNHKLIPIGDHVLDWNMLNASYRLWRFDPNARNPLAELVRQGPMPERLQPPPKERLLRAPKECEAMTLTCVQGMRPIDEERKNRPGTIDFMRAKIKHVVYYILENRSFDHVLGWLYEQGEKGVNFIGHDGLFQGASPQMFNVDPDTPDNREVHLQKYGLDQVGVPRTDPYHDMTDTMRQYFFDGGRYDRTAYERRKPPYMGGFVWNQGTHDVMKTFTPEMLPVLSGLARAFAVSDEWFCSMPGATDSQRAFALTGSALGQLNNFMNGPQYADWPHVPHRGSIWKVLWTNGFDDWKIYNSVQWQQFVLTYHLFLEGQIPAVDKVLSDYLAGKAKTSKYIGTFDQFKDDARQGNLPAFSFLEPVWIESATPATSYHPYGGGGTAPGEQALNEIYEALKNGPGWEDTLLIVTFDEHGGFFDHVPPPYAARPWPNDENDGFRYDLMGVRVPTILVSPWIKEQTVFRSPTEVKYDSTSILSTLLHWRGVPKARWGLGDRTRQAPTFEGVFQCDAPRRDAPELRPRPAAEHGSEQSLGVTDIHRVMVPRLVHALVGDRLPASETRKISAEILLQATDVDSLHTLINGLSRRLG